VFAFAAFLAFLVMALYASLRPFSGWTNPGVNPFAFLGGYSPRAVRRWDVILNFAGYIPLGFFAALALRDRLGEKRAALTALAAMVLFSLAMETTQNYLPIRTPSIVDWVVNTLGAAVGAISAALVAKHFDRAGGGSGLRTRWLPTGAPGDLTLLLAAAWFFTLIAPRTLLFGNGDARAALGMRVRFDVPLAPFTVIEAVITALSVIALALMIRALTRPDAPQRVLFIALLVAGAITRSMGFALFWSTPFAFSWMTKGALVGLTAGTLVGLIVMRWSQSTARIVAVVTLAVTTLVINASPPDPMLWYRLRVVRGAELAPLSAVARNAAMLWPFAAIAVLLLPPMLPSTRRRQRGEPTRP
jgi:VanZ family protein